MPELPEVETVVRGLRPGVVGRRVAGVITDASGMVQAPRQFRQKLTGQRFERIDRHGKWMFFRLSDGPTLVLHLGMTGRLEVVERRLPLMAHTHLRVRLDDGRELRFVDPRRFGTIRFCEADEFTREFGPTRLGPEATRVALGYMEQVLRGTERRIKAVLLDQRRIAGIGNIYADEILYAARVHPARPGRSLYPDEIDAIHRAIKRVLARAIRHQGTSIRDYVTAHGVPGAFQKRLAVYGRAGLACKSCPVGVELSREIIPGRATHFCPACQS